LSGLVGGNGGGYFDNFVVTSTDAAPVPNPLLLSSSARALPGWRLEEEAVLTRRHDGSQGIIGASVNATLYIKGDPSGRRCVLTCRLGQLIAIALHCVANGIASCLVCLGC